MPAIVCIRLLERMLVASTCVCVTGRLLSVPHKSSNIIFNRFRGTTYVGYAKTHARAEGGKTGIMQILLRFHLQNTAAAAAPAACMD